MVTNYLPYYVVCALLWFGVWMAGFWYFRTRRTRGPLFRRLTWAGRLAVIAGVVALPAIYVLSYPLYQQLLAAYPSQASWLGGFADLYVPLQFVQDPDWSYEPTLYLLALATALAVPCGVERLVSARTPSRATVVGTCVVFALAVGCLLLMVGTV